MEYYSITNDNKTATLISALIDREQELHAYELNIENYSAMLNALPAGEWPETLLSYKSASINDIPEEFVADFNSYTFRDTLTNLLKTEKAEYEKSLLVYNQFVASLNNLSADIPRLVATEIARRQTL